MNRFAYRAYYQYDGPTKANPFRTEKTAEEVANALQRFPTELEYRLPEGAKLEIPEQDNANYSVIVVVTPADRAATSNAVESCLIELELYGDRALDCPVCGSVRGGWIVYPRKDEYTCDECGKVHRAARSAT